MLWQGHLTEAKILAEQVAQQAASPEEQKNLEKLRDALALAPPIEEMKPISDWNEITEILEALSAKELQQILKKQGITTLSCERCQDFFNYYGNLPEKLPSCPQCQATLTSIEAAHIPQEYHYHSYLPKIVTSDSQQSLARPAFPVRYKIESLLGRGGMGEVYKAFDTELTRTVALKIMDSRNISEVYISRFLDEVKMLAALPHPNIVTIYSFGREPQLYYTMEYLEGKTLREAFKHDTQEFIMIARVFQKISQALQYTHEKGILHLDIKPSNIMIVKEKDENQEPKLLDFGMAQIENAALHALGGTKEYMSTEQASNQEIDARSDIYSL